MERYSETLKIPEQNTAQVYFLIKRKAAIGYAIVDFRWTQAKASYINRAFNSSESAFRHGALKSSFRFVRSFNVV